MPLTRARSTEGYNRRNYADQVWIDCPEVFYRFDEGTGLVMLDRSGFSRNGVYQSVTFGSASLSGTGNPAASNVRGSFAHPIIERQEFSAEVLVNVPSNSLAGCFLSIGDTNGLALSVGQGTTENPGNNLIGIANFVQWLNTGVNIGTGRHHLAVTAGFNNNLRFYLDGRLVSWVTSNYRTQNNQGFIGSFPNTTAGSLPSVTFDEFALYGCELPGNRIYAHWKAAQLGI